MNHCRSLIYPESHTFPIIIRCCKKHLHRCQLARRLHFCNIKIGNLLAYSNLFCPHVVIISGILKYGCVQGECFKREFIPTCTLHFAFFHPCICQWVLPLTFQLIWTDFPDILFFTTGKIDVPFSFQIVQFRCPDMLAHRTTLMLFPNDHFLCLWKICQFFCPAQYNAVICRNRCRKIIPAILFIHIRICSLQNPGFIKFQSLIHMFSPLYFIIL